MTMKKMLIGAALTFAMFAATDSTAQTFDQAIQEYNEQTGTTTYEGKELEPQGHRIGRLPKDVDGDGVVDYWICCNEFWLFGIRIWSSSEVWFEFPE
jgi:hypothetical protein